MANSLFVQTTFSERVERAVNEYIRPSLQLHQGDICVRDVHDGEVWVELNGACKGCPSAQVTMDETVKQTLTEILGNELKAVHLVNEVDEDLLNFARNLLNKNK
ncbi:MAG: hypothetical protein A2X19_10015 [Bacteroidetes bacterium GWE2_39_28]|nr:MAG: hypothetical protein A2X19_10015 [Bacteroidetes bacterium GWE2_39_28]OFZ08992.1 MAG: hypothetical protein A2322_03025 [Bacteroidetes bacterium RIFOXYB2_FULL_39_7]OFZ11930.1 MAG: hypothetical protein A2465_08220 [Bacteroidetes bacterium RIFOXYC2_FULL_39_11]